jgi:hypothetical protein
MVNTTWIGWLLLLLASATHAQRRNGRNLSNNDDDCLPCHILRANVLREEGGYHASNGEAPQPRLQCITQLEGRGYRQSFDIDLPDALLQSHLHSIKSGKMNVCIEGGYVNQDRIVLPSDADLRLDQVVDNNRRRLQNDARRRGTKRLLAVRVSSTYGEVPVESVESIVSALFGNSSSNPDENMNAVDATVVAQYAAVTHHQLLFLPATGPNITDGILEITVPVNFTGNDIQALTPTILSKMEEVVGPLSDVADNFVFCLPTGSLFRGVDTWTAFTFLYEPVRAFTSVVKQLEFNLGTILSLLFLLATLQYSYYQNSRCTRLSVVMHEVSASDWKRTFIH